MPDIFSPDFNQVRNASIDFHNNSHYQMSRNFLQHAYRRMDITKVIDAFRDHANAPVVSDISRRSYSELQM
jgi:hypothetical protein